MNKFGEALRRFRNASNDPERDNKRLTQERLGDLIGAELGDLGVTGAAISEWELGKSKPEEHKVLIALVCVLHKCGGLKTLAEAQQLLKWGDYRALEGDEIRTIFPDVPDGIHVDLGAFGEKDPESGKFSWLANMFSVPKDELHQLIDKATEGPEPAWPRVLAALMRKASDRTSLSIMTLSWAGLWILTLWVISPSMRFPFDDYITAFSALCIYAGGSLVIPLFIGALVNTKDSAYWKQQDGVDPKLLRLYTYQGAGVGFNVGYFLVFPLSLVRHYLGFGPTIWIEILAVTVSVILGNMAARVVPHNLWRAYGQLTLRDGWIFFVVALMGPLWAFFFLEFYSTLLHPVLGVVVILLAFSGVVLMARRNSTKQ